MRARVCRALAAALEGWTADPAHTARATQLAGEWDAIVQAAYDRDNQPLPAQSQVIGAVNELSDPRDVVLCAAGSMPGDLHKLWRTRDRKGYHVEYGFSCMGYEIAGGLGVKLAALDEQDARDVFVMVGDGSYLMMNTELVTAVAEGVKIIVVLVQNHGFASIGALSESLGSQRFGTQYRYRTETGLDGDRLPVDLAANAASLGADVLTASSIEDFRAAVLKAKQSTRTTVIHVETDPHGPGSGQSGMVGRPGGGGLRPRLHPAGPHGVRGAQDAPAQPPCAHRQRQGSRMSTYDHWIAGASVTGESDRFADVYDPAVGAPKSQVRLATAGDVDAAVQAAAKAYETWGESSVTARSRIMFDFRQLLVEHEDELAAIISSEHGKTLDDAKGEVVRGREVVEFAAGIPQLLKGEFSDQVSGGVDCAHVPPVARCRRGHHTVQLPDHGAVVDAPGRDRVRQHVHPQALRARPRCVRPGGPPLPEGRPARRRVQRRAR